VFAVVLVGCGTTKHTNSLGMEFIPVPGTSVKFSIWETRVKDYAAYATANTGIDESWKMPAFKQGDEHPVVLVSWRDAQAFCEWLTKKEQSEGNIRPNQRYRLPTDAEWSAAVGLGEEKGATPKEKSSQIKGHFPWGNQWPPPRGAGNYHQSLGVDDFEHTSPVGSFKANKFGLFDLGGNVWEVCLEKIEPGSLEHGPRGGGWNNNKDFRILSSRRVLTQSDHRFSYLGFRCVLSGK
tara:strand:- start:257 stop:967 length:711 start_codon:yes stop_codon:yes gene_type:complete